jgi:hypothetical protein
MDGAALRRAQYVATMPQLHAATILSDPTSLVLLGIAFLAASVVLLLHNPHGSR